MSGEKTLCQRYCEDSVAGRPSVLARAMPGRFAEGSCPPTGQLEKFFHGCRLSRQPRHFFCWEESRPWCGLGRRLCRAGAAGLRCRAGNPVATAGLKGQSCAHARIEWGNPAPTTGLTAGPRQSRTRVKPDRNRGAGFWQWRILSSTVSNSSMTTRTSCALGLAAEPVLGRASWASQY